MNFNTIIVYFLVCASLVTVVVFCIVIAFKMKEHRERRRSLEDAYKKLHDVAGIGSLEMAHHMIYRSNCYIRNYFIFLYTSKALEILSILFSIATFLFVTGDRGGYESQLVSLLAIVFVIVTIYVSPSKRATQYLNAWRKSDYHVRAFLVELELAKKHSCRKRNFMIRAKYRELAVLLKTIEKSITTDEE